MKEALPRMSWLPAGIGPGMFDTNNATCRRFVAFHADTPHHFRQRCRPSATASLYRDAQLSPSWSKRKKFRLRRRREAAAQLDGRGQLAPLIEGGTDRRGIFPGEGERLGDMGHLPRCQRVPCGPRLHNDRS